MTLKTAKPVYLAVRKRFLDKLFVYCKVPWNATNVEKLVIRPRLRAVLRNLLLPGARRAGSLHRPWR